MTTAVKDMALTEAKASSELPAAVTQRGLTRSQWNTLCRSLYPGATPNSVLLVVDYCRTRGLDPLKKPCHIVPMQVKDAKTGAYDWRDVVMPGIYELRTTAQRTGVYLGHSQPEYGPVIEFAGVSAPEWCAMTMYRWNTLACARVEFPVRVFFREVVGTKKDLKANDRWSRAPIQMLSKTCEAAGLREAFPDEIGGEQTAEEMDGQRSVSLPETKAAEPSPDGYDDWLADLQSAAEENYGAFETAWSQSSEGFRKHLAKTAPDALERLKRVAAKTPISEGEVIA